jgi:indole-3-acetate monooxygenase
VVDLLFEAGGGSSIYESSRLERCFRDVHMISHHFLVNPSTFLAVGQALLNPAGHTKPDPGTSEPVE